MKNPKFVSHNVVLLIIATIIITSSCVAEPLPSGEKREVTSYQNLELEGAFIVTLVQGNEESIVIDATADEVGQVISKVHGGTLKIYTVKQLNSLINHSLFISPYSLGY